MESENYEIGEMVELKVPHKLLHKKGVGEVMRIKGTQMLVKQNGNIVMYSFDEVKKTDNDRNNTSRI